MTEELSSELNVRDLPNELIQNILNNLNDDDLITQIQIPGFRYNAIEIVKKRLDKLSIRNLVRLYTFRDLRVAVGQYYTECLLLLKYYRIKEIYQNETDPTVRTAIEARIAENFVDVAGQEIPENFNVIKQIDIIRAIIFADEFAKLVETNGGPFLAFTAITQTEQRTITFGIIDMINVEDNAFGGHSYSLKISIGSDANTCRLTRESRTERGGSIERDINCDFNSIFERLFHSIRNNYSFKKMTIYAQTVGNNQIGQSNKVFSI